MNLNSLFMSEGNQAPLITCIISSQRWSMVAAASCSGVFFSGRDWGSDQRRGGKPNADKYKDILNEKLAQNIT